MCHIPVSPQDSFTRLRKLITTGNICKHHRNVNDEGLYGQSAIIDEKKTYVGIKIDLGFSKGSND